MHRNGENMKQYKIAVTMGDPAGIGPEVTVKALGSKEIPFNCIPVVIGDRRVLEKALHITGMEHYRLETVTGMEQARTKKDTIYVMDLGNADPEQFEMGKVSGYCGKAAYEYIETAIRLAMDKEADATVTNAINKEAVNLAGFSYAGHTEIYAKLTGTSQYTMMLAYQNLMVVHVSTHVSLQQACGLVKKERVLEVIRIAEKTCRQLGKEKPRVAVAGLNPHCGENGLFGREEIEEIVPAVKMAGEEGIQVEGPIPADTVFSKACSGRYDIVVAMYHDQGHIPLKLLGFEYKDGGESSICGINITLGLPVIRTSVDHGTAFDIAGKGEASEESLISALKYAVTLAENRKRKEECHEKG